MKAVFILCVLVVTVSARPGEQYTARYDHINLEDVIRNDKLLENYFKCIMDLGKCTSEGKELRTHIPDALQTECSKCTPKQRDGTRFMIEFLINHKPEHWQQLRNKYDPEGKYANKYEKELKKISKA